MARSKIFTGLSTAKKENDRRDTVSLSGFSREKEGGLIMPNGILFTTAQTLYMVIGGGVVLYLAYLLWQVVVGLVKIWRQNRTDRAEWRRTIQLLASSGAIK